MAVAGSITGGVLVRLIFCIFLSRCSDSVSQPLDGWDRVQQTPDGFTGVLDPALR
jgi:hypothetical protein